MEQLRKGYFYSRGEIAEITGYKTSDSKHFKRNVCNKLDNWGYSYKYQKKGILITDIPQTEEEQIKEIMIREYKISSLLDTFGLSCFIGLFMNYEGFESMPGTVRRTIIKDIFKIDLSEITLKRGYKKLADNDLLVMDKRYYSYGYTKETKSEIIRKRVETDAEIAERNNYFNEIRKQLEEGITFPNAMKEQGYKNHVIFYKCSEITLNACGKDASLLFDLIEKWIKRG